MWAREKQGEVMNDKLMMIKKNLGFIEKGSGLGGWLMGNDYIRLISNEREGEAMRTTVDHNKRKGI